MAIILGIDPGSRVTGFGIIEWKLNKASYIASGSINLSEINVSKKLYDLNIALTNIIQKYNPTNSSIERIFLGKNADSALKLGQARGVALMSLYSFRLIPAEYTAKQVKNLITGNGNANKERVILSVMEILNLNSPPSGDAADALAIALTHAFHFNYLKI